MIRGMDHCTFWALSTRSNLKAPNVENKDLGTNMDMTAKANTTMWASPSGWKEFGPGAPASRYAATYGFGPGGSASRGIPKYGSGLDVLVVQRHVQRLRVDDVPNSR